MATKKKVTSKKAPAKAVPAAKPATPKKPTADEVVDAVRTAMYTGLIHYANSQKKTLPEVMAKWFEDDHKSMLNIFAKYLPKESKTEVSGPGGNPITINMVKYEVQDSQNED